MKRILGSVFVVALISSLRSAGADAPTITQHPVAQIVTNGGPARFAVAVSGDGPFTYQWQFNGTNLVPVMVTVAGNGSFGYTGDGEAALSARLDEPWAVAVDNAGNVLISDSSNNSIRKVDTNGIITTVAGNRNWGAGYTGDGGPAISSALNYPRGLAFDSAGNLFVADYLNYRIRKIDLNGTITTVAGNGLAGYSGDGGPATNAQLNLPMDVAFDKSGNLFVSDYYNNCIRKVDSSGIITTVAGNGIPDNGGDGGPATNAGLNLPRGITFDAAGNLFIADCANNRIRKVDVNGIIITVAGTGIGGSSGDGGPALSANFSAPGDIALDAAGNLFIAESTGGRIRKVDLLGIVTTVAGNGTITYTGDGSPATSVALWNPNGIAVDRAGNLLIADRGNNGVRKVPYAFATTPNLTLEKVFSTNAGNYSVIISNSFGSITSEVATLTVLMPPAVTSQPTNWNAPVGATASFSVSASGTEPLSYFWLRNGTPIAGANDSTYSPQNLQLSDSGAQFSCLISNLCGSVTSQVATLSVGIPPAVVQQPAGDIVVTNGNNAEFNVSVSGTGPFTYQWQLNGSNVSPIITTVAGNGTSAYSGDGGPATNAALKEPIAVAFDAKGNLYIADLYNNRIRKVDASGNISTFASVNNPSGLAFDSQGNLYVATWFHQIWKIKTNGVMTAFAGTGGGNFSGDGGPAISAELNNPAGIAWDKGGNLFIADSYNERIRKIDARGIITTVAGNGGFVYAEGQDGGPATNAYLWEPSGVASDSAGTLFIADIGNGRIRRVDSSGIITTIAGNGIGAYGGDGGPATSACLNLPDDIAFDVAGNLFISDLRNHRIRKVDAKGIITTVAGNGAGGYPGGYSGDGGPASNAQLSEPNGIAFDADGNLFIADRRNNRIRKVSHLLSTKPNLALSKLSITDAGDYSVIVSNPFGSVTSQVAKLTVLAPPSILSQPTNQTAAAGKIVTFNVSASGTDPMSYFWMRNGVLVPGADGPIYAINNPQLSDSGAQFCCLITNVCGSVTSQVATLTVGISPSFTQSPVSQTVAAGATAVFDVAVSGTGPFTYQWQVNGTNLCPIITTVAGNGTNGYSGDGGPATRASLYPMGLAVDGAGNLYISEGNSNRVRKIDSTGIITTVAGDANGTSGYSGDGGPAINALLNLPQGMASDTTGNLFISDANNNCIRKVDVDGTIHTIAGKGRMSDGTLATNASLSLPVDVAFDTVGNLFISDSGSRLIRKVDTNGIITTVAGSWRPVYSGDGGPATNASINPKSIAVDGQGNLFILDNYGNFVRKVDTNGIIQKIAGIAPWGPLGDGGPATNAVLRSVDLAVDNAGNVYIADSGNARIRKIDVNGMITTVAGNGNAGFSGDGGSATNAKLNYVQSIAFDSAGNLFAADLNNYRIRKVSYLSAVTPKLTLENISPASAGNYSVIVTSPFGCVTSSVVTLSLSTVLQPQNFAGAITQGTNLTLQFNGATPNHPYVLQSAANLISPISWQPIATNSSDANGLWSLTLTNATAPSTRFYRVMGQ